MSNYRHQEGGICLYRMNFTAFVVRCNLITPHCVRFDPTVHSPEASESFLFVSCCFLVSCQCTFRKFSLVKSLTDKEIVTFFLLNPIEFGGLCHRICNLYQPSANTGVFHVTITDDKDLQKCIIFFFQCGWWLCLVGTTRTIFRQPWYLSNLF